jgi:hypothetical protein
VLPADVLGATSVSETKACLARWLRAVPAVGAGAAVEKEWEDVNADSFGKVESSGRSSRAAPWNSAETCVVKRRPSSAAINRCVTGGVASTPFSAFFLGTAALPVDRADTR